MIMIAEHPGVIDPMQRFMQAILQPLTLSELLADLPDAVQLLLPPRAWCEVVADSSSPEEPDARLCLPVRDADQLIAIVMVNWEPGVGIDAECEQRLNQAADLIVHAVLNRRLTDAERQRARAEAADVRFDLVGMLAHEMRTPLASIKGYASALLLDEIDLDSTTTIEFLGAIEEESDRLNDLVTQLLDSTVIEAGALEIQPEPVLLPALIRRTVETMARRTDRHKIVVSCSTGLTTVFADEQRVQQVLINLIDNAIKYSPDGGMILVRAEKRNAEAVVAVSDQGIGIAPEHLNKLFERFFRTSQRQINGVRGTGLGLPIVEAIVRAHGGRIWAASEVDEGTTLTFTLPLFEQIDGNDASRDE